MILSWSNMLCPGLSLVCTGQTVFSPGLSSLCPSK